MRAVAIRRKCVIMSTVKESILDRRKTLGHNAQRNAREEHDLD